MARNEEKALTLFNKWDTFKRDFHKDANNRRPLVASDCNSLGDAEKWRRDLIKDVTKKIAAIHNATLGEHRIRELNDDINKIMRQKHYWEIRIRELGGDVKMGKQFYDVEGKELPGNPGYKYYGAAKNLPGVRELFAEKDEEQELKKNRRSRADLYKFINPDYYGYRDEDDGILIAKEAAKEKELIGQMEQDFKKRKAEAIQDIKRSGGVFGADQLAMLEEDDEDDDVYVNMKRSALEAQQRANSSTASLQRSTIAELSGDCMQTQVAVPTQEDMASLLIDQKKKLLLEKYS